MAKILTLEIFLVHSIMVLVKVGKRFWCFVMKLVYLSLMFYYV